VVLGSARHAAGGAGGTDAPAASSLVYQPPIEVRSIPLDGPLGLSYVQGDMGPESDWAPKPVVWDPALGLYLVDPGKQDGSPEPSLQRFGPDGRRIFRTPLRKALKLARDVPVRWTT
jgi:hypothetical protein